MRRRRFSTTERSFIEQRAQYHCEYCMSPLDFSPETFDIEHILPLSKDGSNELGNLALSCGGCNARKHDFTHGLDEITQETTPLFHPRLDIWKHHFHWDDTQSIIIGKTSIGRATINTLELNRKGVVNLRKALIKYGVFPPEHVL